MGAVEYTLKVRIVDDRRLEKNELIRIAAIPPVLPMGHIRCTADIIIIDNDGKLLIHVKYMLILFI